MLAMNDEISSMHKNHVWNLVDIPKDRKAITNKWVLKIKRKADGSMTNLKLGLWLSSSHRKKVWIMNKLSLLW